MQLLLAALQWDPQIRGALIVTTAILILCGSVYLLLATNTGARLGLLLAVTGLTGWLFLMGIIWTVFGIGLKGRANAWVTKEIVTGEVSQSTLDIIEDFPDEFREMKTGEKVLADAQAAADQVLAPSTAPVGGHGPTEAPEEPEFPPPFKKATDYVHVKGYETGGDNEVFTIRNHKFYLKHSPHWAVIQVQPAKVTTGAALKAERDPSKPLTTVVMIRDLGSVRVPPAMVALFSGIVFGVCCYVLHQRDKEIMRARTTAAAA